jgi:transcriptional regulator with XRE-family HTH domain
MTDRILEIMKRKGLTPSQFADEIGVQRSSISHLISGRNKPSLEFLQKLMARFGEIDPGWLLTGSGNPVRDEVQNDVVDEKSGEPLKPDFGRDSVPARNKSENTRMNKRSKPAGEEKTVEKIILFYSDKSFREYFPG